MINQIQDDTGAEISIEDDGTVYIGATDGPSAEAARAMVNAIANPTMPEVGERYLGTVVKTTTFGAFVSLLPGQGRPAAHLADPQDGRRQAGRERRGRRSRSARRSRSRSPRSTRAASSRSSRSWRRRGLPTGDGAERRLRPATVGADGRTSERRPRRRTPDVSGVPAAADPRGSRHQTVAGQAGGRRRAPLPSCPAASGCSPRRCPAVRSVTFGCWVGVGSRDEATGHHGSTHFLEHLLFKGTARRSALDIAAAFDAVGGEANAVTGKEHTCYYARVLDEDLPLAADVITDMVTSARLDRERRRERARGHPRRARHERRRPGRRRARALRRARPGAAPAGPARSAAPPTRSRPSAATTSPRTTASTTRPRAGLHRRRRRRPRRRRATASAGSWRARAGRCRTAPRRCRAASSAQDAGPGPAGVLVVRRRPSRPTSSSAPPG